MSGEPVGAPHCPECGTTVTTAEAIEFTDVNVAGGVFSRSERFFIASCADCGHTFGGGVAGAEGVTD